MRYSSRYIHKIATASANPGDDVTLQDSDKLTTKALAKALRTQGILWKGARILSWRIEENSRIVVFPMASCWHSIILELIPCRFGVNVNPSPKGGN